MVQIILFTLMTAALVSTTFAAPIIESRHSVRAHRPGTGNLPWQYVDSVEFSIRELPPAKARPRGTIGSHSKTTSNFIRELEDMEMDARELRPQRPSTTRVPSFLNRRAPAVAINAHKSPPNLNNTANVNLKQKRSIVTSELDARRFNIGRLFKTVGKVASNFIRKDTMEISERESEYDHLKSRRMPKPYDPTSTVIRKHPMKQGLTVGKHFIRDEDTGAIDDIREVTEIDVFD